MFVIPTLATLFVFLYLRPHEVFEALKPLTLNLVCEFLAWGYALDLRLGFVRVKGSAIVGLGISFLAFCALSHAVKAPETMALAIAPMTASLLAIVLMSEGLPGFRSLEVMASVLLAITLSLGAIGVHQAFTPLTCYMTSKIKAVGETSDGRRCEEPEDCRIAGRRDTLYGCEHAGIFGTHSIQHRVRYRGILQDPNELAWTVTMGAPLAFALYERRRSKLRLLALSAMLVLGAICVIKTQSRAGQLCFAAMLGVYFIRKFGWRGALAASLAVVPVLLLGGRGGEEASNSTEERLEAWKQGLIMFTQSPFWGVGHGQFTQHHYLTAHSALVLTLAELGPVGFFLWTALIYIAFKITVKAQLQYSGGVDQAAPARAWSLAVLASLTGTIVSAFFLSIPYHPILWIDLGLAGALYTAIRAHDPDFVVRFGLIDAGVVIAGDVAIFTTIKIYLILHRHG